MNEKNYKRIEQETVQRKNVEESTIQRYFAINVEILASRYTASSAVNGFISMKSAITLAAVLGAIRTISMNN